MNLSKPSLSGTEAEAVNETAATSLWKRAGRDMVLFGAGTVGAVALQFAFRALLVATLIPPVYGRLSLVLAVYSSIWILGASGLPNSVARHIAVSTLKNDTHIIRTAVRAAAWPTLLAATGIAIFAGVILHSPLAIPPAVLGMTGIIYTILAMGILRGRGRMPQAATVLMSSGLTEVTLLGGLLIAGFSVNALTAFSIFCFGNVSGLMIGAYFVVKTTPRLARTSKPAAHSGEQPPPSARELLTLSAWLGIATAGGLMLPLALRFAAAFSSFTTVAIVDLALMLFAVPQRIGSVIVASVVPHASRAVGRPNESMTITRREQILLTVPFVLAAICAYLSPIVTWAVDILGQPVYAASGPYLALALLAGPARILYGFIEGVLTAHGDGRFLAVNALTVTAIASALIIVLGLLHSETGAFVVFVLATWSMYLSGLRRVGFLNRTAT